jgi:glyoxylase-like metal-dependent hydrolase (beta-lactamase superfamily II)
MKKDNPEISGLARRDFLKAAGAVTAIVGLPFLAKASPMTKDENTFGKIEAPLPLVDPRFPSRIAEGIWLITDKRIPLIPNIGIVEGKDAVLVIDSGINGYCGELVLYAARKIAGKRKIILTITHAHPEHTFGSQAFKNNGKIIYNKMQKDYLESNGEKLLKGFREILSQDKVWMLDKVSVTLPDEVYDGDQHTIDLGKRKVIFQNWGKAHSPGDQVVIVPDAGVIFAGDLIEERKFPIVPYFPPLISAEEIDLKKWEQALKEIINMRPTIIVPGHGNIGGPELIEVMLNYFSEIRKLVTSNELSELTKEDLLADFSQIIKSKYSTWEQDEFIRPALQYLML